MKMPEKMDRVIALAGGEIIHRETNSFGVMLGFQKSKEDLLLKPCLLQCFSNYLLFA